MIKKYKLVSLYVLLFIATSDCYSQPKDTLAYKKITSDTTRFEHFAGIQITKDTHDVIILIKHDSLYVTYKNKNHHVRSFQELNDFVKYVLMDRKGASFAVFNYFESAYESKKSYDKVVRILKKNKIYDFATGVAYPAGR